LFLLFLFSFLLFLPLCRWPPSKTWQKIDVTATASDNCGVVCRVDVQGIQVQDDLPEVSPTSPGDSPDSPDSIDDSECGLKTLSGVSKPHPTEALSLYLCRERTSGRRARVYVIPVVCSDAAGNSVSRTASVTVPASQSDDKSKGKDKDKGKGKSIGGLAASSAASSGTIAGVAVVAVCVALLVLGAVLLRSRRTNKIAAPETVEYEYEADIPSNDGMVRMNPLFTEEDEENDVPAFVPME
jgi:hypothetical protein